MFIAEATIDLKDIKIFDKLFNIRAGSIFLARDGLLHEQIKAGNIKILAESSQLDLSFINDYIVFENESNKNIFDTLLVKRHSNKNNIENKVNKISIPPSKKNIKNKKGAKKQCKRK